MKLSTGKVAFPIEFDNGDKDCIYFNPNDPDLATRLIASKDKIQKRIEEMNFDDFEMSNNGEAVVVDEIKSVNDLNEANRYGYNLLAIKYGFMEESIDKVHFEKIKDNLPKLSQKRISLQEAIISLQLEMLEDFSKIDEIKARNMRSFYSSYDTISDVSYETYLRGELSSYSENTVFLYGKMLSDYSKNDGNYVKAVINYTDIFK